jgi:hypothetical protein
MLRTAQDMIATHRIPHHPEEMGADCCRSKGSPGISCAPENLLSTPLPGCDTSAHNFVHKQELRRNDASGMDHLSLHAVVVENTKV